MGIVVRQSIITTIISYVGVVIGYINLIFLYPKYLELEQVGLIRSIQDSAMLLTPFASVGLVQSISRFYPRFAKDKLALDQFTGLLVLLSFGGFVILMIVFFLFRGSIISFFSSNAPEINQHISLILWLTLTLLYSGIFEQFARSQLKIAVPVFLRDVGVRMLQSFLVSLYTIDWISFGQFLIMSVFVYVLTLVVLIIYLRLNSTLNVKFSFTGIKKDQLKEIAIFSGVSFVGLSSMVLIAKIDSVMVAGLLGLSMNAIYTTSYYMATVIEIPKRAITQSSSTLISNAFERGDIQEVNTLYLKASINQFIIGSLLLLGVWINADNIFSIMPKGELYRAGQWVILIVGTGKLLDMFFGPSSEIIGLSKYYWFNLLVISFLALSIVAANIILIPLYGMNGAAIGTLLALFFYNFFKFVFIFMKMNLNPFTINTLKVVLVILLTYFINTLIPPFTNCYLDIFVRSSVVTITFSSLTLIMKCSGDANKLFMAVITRLGFK